MESIMGVLEGCRPERVFYYFEEISKIPHGSGNIEKISGYLKDFADRLGLVCIQDKKKNIVIIKEATAGYEQEPPIVLQGHMDMVAVKEPGVNLDMAKEGLVLQREGDMVSAKGTSLGGDDGIAVAYCLALLGASDISHPRLEVILTVDEETGMEGAAEIDLSILQGRRLINLDSEEEGEFLVSCAGGVRVDICLPVRRAPLDGGCYIPYRVCVRGLQGGHSGTEIIREGGNANLLLGRTLAELLSQKLQLRMSDCEGGSADNAIPTEAEAFLWVAAEEEPLFREKIELVEQEIRQELGEKDSAFCIEKERLEVSGETPMVLEKETAQKAVDLLLALPNGVQAMSVDIKGLVETSLNLGIMKLNEREFSLGYAVRSSVTSARDYLCRRMEAVARLAGAELSMHGAYPGWAYRKDSALRDKMVRIYEKMYGKTPVIKALHAGVECGLFMEKLPGLDCVSIGPDMQNVHTTQETLSISSTERVWEFLCAVLQRKED